MKSQTITVSCLTATLLLLTNVLYAESKGPCRKSISYDKKTEYKEIQRLLEGQQKLRDRKSQAARERHKSKRSAKKERMTDRAKEKFERESNLAHTSAHLKRIEYARVEAGDLTFSLITMTIKSPRYLKVGAIKIKTSDSSPFRFLPIRIAVRDIKVQSEKSEDGKVIAMESTGIHKKHINIQNIKKLKLRTTELEDSIQLEIRFRGKTLWTGTYDKIGNTILI